MQIHQAFVVHAQTAVSCVRANFISSTMLSTFFRLFFSVFVFFFYQTYRSFRKEFANTFCVTSIEFDDPFVDYLIFYEFLGRMKRSIDFALYPTNDIKNSLSPIHRINIPFPFVISTEVENHT